MTLPIESWWLALRLWVHGKCRSENSRAPARLRVGLCERRYSQRERPDWDIAPKARESNCRSGARVQLQLSRILLHREASATPGVYIYD
ncbi:hypothetical protein [[Phormidium] sp. ETS-05]|uniref:hypothetical protein n=1 Tax=[Phormidium] sp. ETS-05 TaxID=222819 RepID=UPI0018EF1B7B|nr:hypothetical protein [[Phormidium] sp. ETS-05]